MKQIIQNAKSGKLGLKEVPVPCVSPGFLLVRTQASLISAGTERLVIDFAKKNFIAKAKARPDLVRKVLDKAKRDGFNATFKAVMARLDRPLPLGYSAAGIVMEVGKGLEGRYRVGQRVACAGAGVANHADFNLVPENLAALIPNDVPSQEACYGTLGAIALHGVRNLNPKLGEWVAVLGVGLLGQLAVQFLSLAGCRVIALDYVPDRLDLAVKIGADLALNLSESHSSQTTIKTATGGLGCDGILICAATTSSEPVTTAAAIARDRGKIVMVGMTGTEFSYRDFMQKELSITVSRSYGPGRYDDDYEKRGTKYPIGFIRWTETENLKEAVRLMSPSLKNRLDVAALTTHVIEFNNAKSAYELVTKGKSPHLGVVLNYTAQTNSTKQTIFPQPKINKQSCTLGVFGAGNFAHAILLPHIKAMRQVTLHTLVTTSGATSNHGKATFGFMYADTNPETIFGNSNINAILIATRHSSHAKLTRQALTSGKSVLVEKPLALNRKQLNEIITARHKAKCFFQVGFNRRFAPLAIKMRHILHETIGPKMLSLRINAGTVAPDSWINLPTEGGGRILGEICHFVDLARFFIKSPIISVQADAAATIENACDDLAITLRFNDGSLATIIYTAQGDTSYSKERLEGFANGRVCILDDFRRLTIVENGKTRTENCTQNKGFKESISAFVNTVISGGAPPINEEELIETSLSTIAVTESLRKGRRIDL